MRAIAHYCYGAADQLKLEKVAKPSPSDKQVLVKVHRAAVNPLDYHMMRGAPYFIRLGRGIGHPERNVMGADYAGVVEAVGSNVSRFKPGDRVFGGSRGAYADYIMVAEDSAIALIPENVSFEQASAVGVAASTALQALRDHGQLTRGQSVLINGASGGVGTYAVQIAKSMGAEVAGVCSTRNVERVVAIGADRVFDYKKESYIDSGEKYDLIVDMVSNHSISDNRKVLKPGGRYVMVGGSKGNWLGPLAQPISAMIQNSFVDEELIFFVASLTQADTQVLADMMAQGSVTSVIDRVYELEQVAEAISYSESRRARGKIIIRVSD
ncbi:NAD(P)-dependent alcohol dehydrogenase [Aliikangiella marina]|uniref:NAD(P)-dependent alcohol dehydrogenase n=2 Tax=Aliikangiella marina TaxID=1712262 RepID=A0A545TEJ8_9GAMM|nr:NAD(P)-dependent alcohol dehydrogenase [Aliikangiella marina]